MKKIFIILILALTVDKIFAKEITGYYINLTDDTVKINFKITTEPLSTEINYSSLQCGVIMYNEKHKKVYLKPEEMKEVHFDYENEHYRFVTFSQDLRLCSCFYSDKYLLRQLIDGNLKLFTYTFHNQGAMQTGGRTAMFSGEVNILQKQNGELFKIDYFNFKKTMSEYLSDCPELVTKIQEKIYGKDDLYKIIQEYNQSCKSGK
ncbi:MAG: hypothetical protein H0W73_05645 [Bacteroidetes bacterium]|nr:hypothetical protein [Bacteroidota bacterium]